MDKTCIKFVVVLLFKFYAFLFSYPLRVHVFGKLGRNERGEGVGVGCLRNDNFSVS